MNVFGIPGEETLDLLDSLKYSPIERVLTRHEQAAGFMAATAMRLKLSLVVIILRDEHYAHGPVEATQSQPAVEFGNPDLVKYGEAYGAKGHRLENADLAGLLKECLATAGVHVIDVPVDYSDNEHIMSRCRARSSN